jgi:hypothetical protein
VHSEVPPHEKIRFRRGDITNLDHYPSAAEQPSEPQWRKASRGTVKTVLGLLVAIPVTLALLFVVLLAGLGNERLRTEAQAVVTNLLGDEFDAHIGGARISFDSMGLPALEVSNARLIQTAAAADVLDVGSLRFGIRILPLARGEVRLGSVRLDDARIELASLPERGDAPPLPFFDEAGLFDADAAMVAVFEGIKRGIGAFGGREIDRVELGNVELVLPGEAARVVRIENATVRYEGEEALSLSARIAVDGRVATLEGEASLDAARARVETLNMRLAAPLAEDADGAGELSATLSGSQTVNGNRFSLIARVGGLQVPVGGADVLAADIDLSASAVDGQDKIEIENLRVATGRSTWRFNGAFGPDPNAGEPSYRFELVSDGSTVSPQGSPEPAMPIVARLAGNFDPAGGVLTVPQLDVRSAQGEVRGSAAVRFAAGKTPGLELALDVDRMPVGQVKQLWPWFAARGARNWVVANIYGGRVENGRLDLSVPPGRMGNGVPFGADDISGQFTIRGTRFDVAGRIPPVRDGNGAVVFRGTDVDISLESGTVFMPGGRTVNARNGVLAIRDAHSQPVIGKLTIDVEGEADGIMQLASYDPIDVSRFIDLKPDDLSGKVSGTVTADIPLQRSIPVESLGWRVELDYEDLALATPFEGQTITAAVGSIDLDPSRAVINAKAQMNGVPATIEMVEPLGASQAQRERRIAMQLDDNARNALVPGLKALLSGTTEVKLDDAVRERRAIEASLGNATLSIPWAGWSKGRGVPGSVAFAMQTDGDRVDLADFRLSGETFGAAGTLSFVGGEVSSIRLPSVRLNRGDDFSFDMRAQGRGYAITVRGNSIDARSIVKLYAKDSEGGTTSAGGADVPIALDLEAASMTGFHGEVLRDVKLSYSGTGARTDRLEFSAITSSGRPVAFRDGRDGEARAVSMSSSDAGAVLRFLDIYEHMQEGTISMSLAGQGGGPLRGQVDARNFWVVNEPRLASLVSTPPANDNRSLNQAVRGQIDTSRVHFERGFSVVEKSTGSLKLEQGVLRGPLIGSTFQGTFYDPAGNMDMTGTFMPAYGINRIFGEIPLIGQILGNGRDRGLIGITFRLAGASSEPQLQVNPLSVIAPGIFRSVFEYR